MGPPQKGDRGTYDDGTPVMFDGTGWVKDTATDSAPTSGGMLRGLATAMGDLGIGAAKQLGKSAATVGQAISDTPFLGHATTALGNAMAGTSATAPAQSGPAYDVFRKDMEQTNPMQQAGGVAEQIAEFFLPGPKTGRAVTSGLAHLIPDAASPAAMRTMNKVAAVGGRVIGDAANAAGVSALHGDENVDDEAEIAGGATLSGEALAALEPIFLHNPMLRKTLPIILAASIGHHYGGASGAGIGATLGMFGVKKNIIDDIISILAKNTTRTQNVTRTGARLAGAGAAGVHSEHEPRRRALAGAQ